MKTRALLSILLTLAGVMTAVAQSDYDRGVEAFTAHNYDEARKHFNEAIAARPDDAYSMAYLGLVECREEKYHEARTTLTDALGRMPADADKGFMAVASYHLGKACAEEGDTIEAIQALSRSAELDPDNADYPQECGIMMQNTRRYGEALGMLLRAAELRPDDALTQAGLGYTYIGLKERDNAIAAFTRAAELDADNAEHYNGVVAALAEFNPDMTVDVEVTERDATEDDDFTLPEFPGGTKALKSFVAGQIVYPEKARDGGAEGTVVVDCLIDEEGAVTETKVVQMVHAALDEEALRVCALLPAFKPATRNGEAVPSWVQVPVRFELP